MPNPNFPVIDKPRGEAHLFEHFRELKNHTVAVVPDNEETQVKNNFYIKKTILISIFFQGLFETSQRIMAKYAPQQSWNAFNKLAYIFY